MSAEPLPDFDKMSLREIADWMFAQPGARVGDDTNVPSTDYSEDTTMPAKFKDVIIDENAQNLLRAIQDAAKSPDPTTVDNLRQVLGSVYNNTRADYHAILARTRLRNEETRKSGSGRRRT